LALCSFMPLVLRRCCTAAAPHSRRLPGSRRAMGDVAAAGGAADSRPRRPALFVCRHGEREDYAWSARGENWQAQADRPWDTPLTPSGHLQARALGESLVAHWYDTLNVAPISRVVVSPLLRCVETGAAVAEFLGLQSVGLEPRLAETMCEEWYRSWAVPGANSTWGGPDMGKPLPLDDLHPAAQGPASACHATATSIQALREARSLSSVGRGVEVVAADRDAPVFEYSWDKFESEAEQAQRMRSVAQAELPPLSGAGASEAAAGAGSVLLVSHGGPTGALYHMLMEETPPYCGYCGLFAYVRSDAPAGWAALVAGNHDHLDRIEGAAHCGPNDAVEQQKAKVGKTS